MNTFYNELEIIPYLVFKYFSCSKTDFNLKIFAIIFRSVEVETPKKSVTGSEERNISPHHNLRWRQSKQIEHDT